MYFFCVLIILMAQLDFLSLIGIIFPSICILGFYYLFYMLKGNEVIYGYLKLVKKVRIKNEIFYLTLK